MNQDRSTTITNPQLKEGYKQTEVGVIPEDWELLPCSALSNLITVGIVIRPTQYYVKNGVSALRSANIREAGISESEMVFISEKANAQLAKSQVREGDVLTVRTGYPGTSAVVTSKWAGSNCIDILITRPSSVVNSEYLTAWINSSFGKYQVLKNQGGLAQQHFNVGDLRNLLVAVPPLPEQEAIACTLSDIDALIESLDRLLTKKRQIKQGAMQELLRSKDGWVEKKLSEIAEIRSGGTPSTSRYEFWDGDILWCTPTDITALKGYKYLVNTSRLITSQGLSSSSAEMIPANSVVMTSRATIGECAINKVPVSTNQGFKNFIPFDETNVEFLYYLLQTQKQRFISLCGGSTFLEIGKNQLSEFLIELPPLLEQIEIANILSDMDAEIGLIESKLTKTRQLKQGMMHELLTGRIRLVD
jgi:type I restriction enzyme, S subunit